MAEGGERYSPPEAREFKATGDGARETKGPQTTEGLEAMQNAPEASGSPTHREGPDGELITTEKAEKNHNPESTVGIGAGIGPRPRWSRDPSDSGSATAATAGDVNQTHAASDDKADT